MDGNVRGIADTSDDVEGESAPALTKLDAIGKVTKVITKGITMAMAVRTSAMLSTLANKNTTAVPRMMPT